MPAAFLMSGAAKLETAPSAPINAEAALMLVPWGDGTLNQSAYRAFVPAK